MKESITNQDSPWIGIRFSGEDLDFLTLGFHSALYRKGVHLIRLFEHNQNILIVDQGTVQIFSSSDDGDVKNVMVATRGNLIGEISAILDRTASIGAQALDDCRVFVIPVAEFKNRLLQKPELAWEFMTQTALKSHILMSQIRMLSFHKPQDRVRRALYWIFHQFAEPVAGGLRLDNRPQNPKRLSHQDIADITGLSRVSVSNAFLALYEVGTLRKADGYLYIDSLESLQD